MLPIRYDQLKETYDRLQLVLGEQREPFEAALVAEQHRQYWRPPSPRVILLAESHVYTAQSELVEMKGWPLCEMEDLPRIFVRLVYCLGYGEAEFAGGGARNNRGTPQFWNIFYSCLHQIQGIEDFAPLRKANTSFGQRIQTKLDVLRSLKRDGIWLLDACVAAIYRPGAIRPGPKAVSHALQASFDSYVVDTLREANPEHVIIVGCGVARALRSRVEEVAGPNVTVLPQPQAHQTRAASLETLKTYYRICRKYAKS